MPQSLGKLIPGSYSFHEAAKLNVLVVNWIEKILTNRKHPHVMTHFLCSNIGGVFQCVSFFSVSNFSSLFNYEKKNKRSLFKAV